MLRGGENCSSEVDLRLLKAAVESSGEAILITSAELEKPGPRIAYANPAFSRMTGYASEEVVGQSPRLLQGPGTDRTELDRARTSLMAGEAFRGETLNYRKDGSAYTVEWLITPVREPHGDIAHWVSTQRDVTERRAIEEKQALMVRELHHRVKNTLATVQAVLNATVRSSTSVVEFGRAFTGRIASLARTHALITEDEMQATTFEQLLRAELSPYDQRGRLTLTGPGVALPSHLAVPVGMALHELTANALQHGALARPEGRLEVSWRVSDGENGQDLRWEWSEHGGPPFAHQASAGFGSRLLNSVLRLQTGADVEIAYEPSGLRTTVRMPLPWRWPC